MPRKRRGESLRSRDLRTLEGLANDYNLIRETYQIGIPHPNDVLDANLAHQEAIDPPETKLNELHILFLKMACKTGIYSRRKVS